jgi:hypothetical protein
MVSAADSPRFSGPEPLLFFQVAPHLSSQERSGPLPDPLLRRNFGSAGNRTQDLWDSSQEPLDYRHRIKSDAVSKICVLFVILDYG